MQGLNPGKAIAEIKMFHGGLKIFSRVCVIFNFAPSFFGCPWTPCMRLIPHSLHFFAFARMGLNEARSFYVERWR
jgi:hypothetical protein